MQISRYIDKERGPTTWRKEDKHEASYKTNKIRFEEPWREETTNGQVSEMGCFQHMGAITGAEIVPGKDSENIRLTMVMMSTSVFFVCRFNQVNILFHFIWLPGNLSKYG